MKRLIILAFIIAVLTAGIAWAADQTTTPPATTTVQQDANSPADTQPQPAETETVKAKMHFGPSVGVFWPTSGKVRDTFGSSFTRYGLRPFITEVPEKGRFMFDLSYYAMDDGTDQATLIPITAGFMKGITQHKDMLTYVSVNVGPFHGNVDAPSVGVDETGWGLNANATLGVSFNERWCLEGRYDYMTKFAGFDFSAFSLSLGYRLFDVNM